MAGTTTHTVIYHGVLLHDAVDLLSVAGWATILEPDDDDLERQLIMHSIDQLAVDRPYTNTDRIRMVEFSWTDMGPVDVPDVPLSVDLIKHTEEED